MPSLCFSVANPNKLAWVLWSYTPNLAHTLTSVLECNSSLVWSKTVQSSVHISRWRESVLACKLGCWNPRGSQPSLWKCSVHARDLEVWLNHQAPDSSPGRTNAVTTSPENSKWGGGIQKIIVDWNRLPAKLVTATSWVVSSPGSPPFLLSYLLT